MKLAMQIVISLILLSGMCASLHAGIYYVSPSGSDGNDGTTPSTSWATLQHSDGVIGPGDTLLIMGGVYSDAQATISPLSGTGPNSYVVFKALGDAPAIFEQGGSNGGFVFMHSRAWIAIDGESYINPGDSTRHIVFRFGAYDGMAANYVEYGFSVLSSHHIRVTGVEFDGLYCGHSNAPCDFEMASVYNMLRIWDSDYFELDNCYVHHVGDSNWHTGYGYGLEARNSDFMRIENCRFECIGHAAIDFGSWGQPCSYATIRNNVFDNGWGGGFYIYYPSGYNLIEGNKIYNSGTAYGDPINSSYGSNCTQGVEQQYPKPCVQLSSSKNVFRGNVIYTPWNQGFDFEAFTGNPVDSNLVYNNTIYYTNWYYGIMNLQVRAAGTTCSGNVVANNIIYRNEYDLYDVGTLGHRIPSLAIYKSHYSHNLPMYNEFSNNLMRLHRSSASDSEVVFAYGYGQSESGRAYSVAEVEAMNPADLYWNIFTGNITDRPQFLSEDPESVSNWWHLTASSPCIDAGVVVYDWIGAYVESRFPGYGWGFRSYVGTAPDIGAFEYGK